jgi:TRAP-type mannitol/chloroaromatic compound transport system permease large subunit
VAFLNGVPVESLEAHYEEADAMISLEWMPPLMFAGLVVFMIIGYPVAFSLAAVGFFFGFLSIEMGYFTMAFMQAIPGRVFGSILSNELLLAIPFFTFMGAILEKCGLAEDMLESMGQLFGPIKGSATRPSSSASSSAPSPARWRRR